MKLETKKWIEKGVILFSPIFTLIMFFLPFMAIVNERTTFSGVVIEENDYSNFFKALDGEANAFCKVIMYVSLVGIIVSIVLFVISQFLKNEENKLIKIALIVILVANGVLCLSSLGKHFSHEAISGALVSNWVDFMTIPYGLLLVYNVGSLIYFVKYGLLNKGK